MSDENVSEKISKVKYVPSKAYEDYFRQFDLMSTVNQKKEVKLLQKIIRQRLVDSEKMKLKERLKKLKG